MMDTFQIGEPAVSADAIQSLCNPPHHSSAMPSESFKDEVVTTRPIPTPHSSAMPSVSFKEEVVTTRPIPTPARSDRPLRQPNVSDPSPAAEDGPGDGSDGVLVGVEVEGGTHETLQARCFELLEQRSAKQAVKKQQYFAKKVLSEAGLDFNTHYQKAHAHRLDKGHWAMFLSAVSCLAEDGDSSLSCQACKDLLRSFNIPAALDRVNARMNPKGKEAPLVPVVCDASEPAGHYECGLVPFDCDGQRNEDEEGNPAKRRRGRPKKDEEIHFNLLDFLSQHRAGQYKLLSEEEARGCI